MNSRNDQTTRPRPRVELSLSQTIGGSLAAATAAVLGSRLGLVGTISGAAVASVVSTVAAAVYTTSLRHTRARLLTGLSVPSRKATAKIALGAATVFAVAATAVTGLELASGRSLTGAAGATSVGQAVQHGSSTTPVRT